MPGGKQRIQSYKQGEPTGTPEQHDDSDPQKRAAKSSSTDEAYQREFDQKGDEASRNLTGGKPVNSKPKDKDGYTSSEGARGGDQSFQSGQSTQGNRVGNLPSEKDSKPDRSIEGAQTGNAPAQKGTRKG